MFKSILGLSAVLGFVAMTAVVGCAGNAASEDSESGGSAIITGKQFTADCTLSTVNKAGKTINGYVAGTFKVGNGNTLTASKPIMVSVGTRGSNDYKLTVKSGSLTDAQNEIFEFTATQNISVAGFDVDTMDITIKYDGVKKVANVDSIVTGKDAYTASCKFKDEAGNDTTNFSQN